MYGSQWEELLIGSLNSRGEATWPWSFCNFQSNNIGAISLNSLWKSLVKKTVKFCPDYIRPHGSSLP